MFLLRVEKLIDGIERLFVQNHKSFQNNEDIVSRKERANVKARKFNPFILFEVFKTT